MAKFNDELIHVVPAIAPASLSTATASDVIGLKEYHRVQFVVVFGAVDASDCVVTVEECDDTTPTTDTAIAFYYRKSSALGTDSMGDRTAATSSGVTIANADDNKILLIDIDASDLSEGYPYVKVVLTPGGTTIAGAVAFLYPRYAKATQISAVD